MIDISEREPVSKRAELSIFQEELVVKSTLNKLIDNRLLVSGRYKSTVEVAHEELLRSWEFVQNLIREKEEIIILKSRLISDAQQWHELKKENEEKAKDELWSGSKLERVLELIEKKTLTLLDEQSEQFIQESKKAIEATQEAEKRRQAEMLRLQEERTQEEEKSAKLAKRIAWGAVSAGIAMAVLVLFFGMQLRATKISQAESLIRLAKTDILLNKDFDALLNLLKAHSYLKAVISPEREVQTEAFKELRRVMHRVKESNRLYRPSFSIDGRYYAGISGKAVHLWDIQTQSSKTLFYRNSVDKVGFVPNICVGFARKSAAKSKGECTIN